MKSSYLSLKIDSDVLDDYLSSPLSSWFFSEVQRQPRFAHHSLCACFDNHLIRICGFPFCLGCFCVSVGASICFLVLIIIWKFGFFPSFLMSCFKTELIGLGLFAPTLIQPFCQVKSFKIISRLCLGMAVTMLCYGGLILLPFSISGFFLRLLFVAIFITVFKISMWYRKKLSKDPAQGCDKGCYPFCSGNRDNLKRVYGELLKRAEPNDPLILFVNKLIDSN